MDNNRTLDIIYNEDCLVGMKRIPDNSIDLIVTSPPYDNLRKYNSVLPYDKIIEELYRVVKKGGVVVWVVSDATVNGSESGTSFKQALMFKEKGFNIHDTMIFAKNNPVPLTHNRYEQSFEYMFIFSKGKPKSFNPIMRDNKHHGKTKTGTHRKTKDSLEKMTGVGNKVKKQSIKYNIWYYSVNRGAISKDLSAHKHPAIFPYQLAYDHIISWSNEGDIVMDIFSGSGTTAIACIDTNRNYIGFELDKEYYELSLERINNHKNK